MHALFVCVLHDIGRNAIAPRKISTSTKQFGLNIVKSSSNEQYDGALFGVREKEPSRQHCIDGASSTKLFVQRRKA